MKARRMNVRLIWGVMFILLLYPIRANRDTALVYSARINNLSLVRLFLALGANPDGSLLAGPAIVSHENTQAIFYTLVEHGAKIPDKVVQDFVYRGNMPELLYCLNHGYTLTEQRKIGLLNCACRYHDAPYNFEMVRFFVEKGADINGKPDYPNYSNHDLPTVIWSTVVFDNWEAFQYLRAKGARLDINGKDAYGRTLPSMARKSSKILQYLLKNRNVRGKGDINDNTL